MGAHVRGLAHRLPTTSQGASQLSCQCLHMHFAVSENELLHLDSHVSEMVVSKFFDIVLIHMLTFDQRLWTVVFPSLLRSSIPLSSPMIVEYISSPVIVEYISRL